MVPKHGNFKSDAAPDSTQVFFENALGVRRFWLFQLPKKKSSIRGQRLLRSLSHENLHAIDAERQKEVQEIKGPGSARGEEMVFRPC